MNRTTMLLAAGLLAVVALLTWLALPEPEPDATDGGTAVLTASPDLPDGVPGHALQLEADDGEIEPLRAGDDADGTAALGAPGAAAVPGGVLVTILYGHVTCLETGAPVPGASVEAMLVDPVGQYTKPALVDGTGQLVTDDDGAYQLVMLLGAARDVHRITIGSGPETAPRRIEPDLSLEPGGSHELDLQVSLGATVRGIVVDLQGRSIGSATVAAWSRPIWFVKGRSVDEPDRTVRADAAGHFEVSAIGPDYVLSADHPGQALASHDRLHGEVAWGSVTEGATLRVSEARELVGRVIDPEGRPVEGATVEISRELIGASNQLTGIEGVFRSGPPPEEQITGSDGRFRFGMLGQQVFDVEVRHPAHPTWRGAHGPGDSELIVRLDAGATLACFVVGAAGSPRAGAPIAGARVVLGDGDLVDEIGNSRRGETDADGRVFFEGLAPVPDAIVALMAEGHAVHVVQPVAIGTSGPNELRIPLQRELRLAGHVVDAEGLPIARARVEIEGDRRIDFGRVTMSPTPTWEGYYFHIRELAADAAGWFAIDRLYDGVFKLKISHPDDELIVTRLEVRAGDEDLVVVLDPDVASGVTLTGVARDAFTGLPVTSFHVTPMIPSANGSGMSGTSTMYDDEAGRWTLSGLDPGPMMLNASAAGFARWHIPLADYEAGEHRIDIDFLATRTITVRVVTPEGEPVSANLVFKDRDGKDLWVDSGPASRTTSLRSDEQGEAIAAGLPADLISVEVKKGWLGERRTYPLDLRPEPRAPFELVYGDEGEQTQLMVFVVGSDDPAASVGGSAAAGDRAALMAALDDLYEGLTSGTLRAPDTRVDVRAKDGGQVVAEGSVDPSGPADSELTIRGVDRPFFTRLAVPGRMLTIEVSAPGYVTESRTWLPPPAGGTVSDGTGLVETGETPFLIVILRRS